MRDAYLCRFGNQDIHKIRGLDRALTDEEKYWFASALEWHMEREFGPKEDVKNGAGSAPSSE